MGRSRGGLTTKIHALVDANGLPILLKLTPGQAHDGRSAPDMLGGLGEGQILLADRGYDSDALRKSLASQGAWGNIKPMPNRVNVPAFSAYLYRFRNLVECFFNKLKHFRAVATRYEKHDANYLAIVKLAAIRIWPSAAFVCLRACSLALVPNSTADVRFQPTFGVRRLGYGAIVHIKGGRLDDRLGLAPTSSRQVMVLLSMFGAECKIRFDPARSRWYEATRFVARAYRRDCFRLLRLAILH